MNEVPDDDDGTELIQTAPEQASLPPASNPIIHREQPGIEHRDKEGTDDA